MLSAKQAREKTDENKVANFRKEIEKLIRHNIEKGRDEAKVSGRIPACSDDDLYRLFEVVIAEMNKRKQEKEG